jgi:hypothetical protein
VVKREQTDDDYLRIKTVDLATKTKVLTIKPNQHYWPCWELVRDPAQPSGWRLLSHTPDRARGGRNSNDDNDQ